jgi:hypothetical protein
MKINGSRLILRFLPALAVLALAGCAAHVGYDDGYYPPRQSSYQVHTTLPSVYVGSAYYYNGRYYSGGRYERGRYNYGGRAYSARYYHSGRYYYGGTHRHYGTPARRGG